MKKLLTIAMVMGFAATAQAQMMNNPPPPGQPPPPQQPQAPAAQFSPDAQKGPEDVKGLNEAIKANNMAWDHQDVQAILNAWVLPAAVVTTDAVGNPSYVQVDDAAIRGAFTAMFNSIPKPGPGQKAAELKFGGQKIEWVSHTLAVVSDQVTLQQGAGKQMFKKQWKVSQIWTREPAGWRVRGYVASGWGDLLRH
ncbi:MAG: hypothetical protein JST54_11870 [Deltaproteobacteria bacterium]|nr:hypothetical protein [Deltaproteobacteria bacterium]